MVERSTEPGATRRNRTTQGSTFLEIRLRQTSHLRQDSQERGLSSDLARSDWAILSLRRKPESGSHRWKSNAQGPLSGSRASSTGGNPRDVLSRSSDFNWARQRRCACGPPRGPSTRPAWTAWIHQCTLKAHHNLGSGADATRPSSCPTPNRQPGDRIRPEDSGSLAGRDRPKRPAPAPEDRGPHHGHSSPCQAVQRPSSHSNGQWHR